MRTCFLAILCLAVATASLGAAEWYAAEPPEPFGGPVLLDGAPTDERIFEIFDTRLDYTAGTFTFDIITNFGDRDYRNNTDGGPSAPNVWWDVRGATGFTYAELAAGDLYIRVRDRVNTSDDVGTVYALALESRGDGDFWRNRVETELGLPTIAVTAGELYGDVMFATGTLERYPGEVEGHQPDMITEASTLPNLAFGGPDNDGLADEMNAYPAILTEGAPIPGGNPVNWFGSDSDEWQTLKGNFDPGAGFPAAYEDAAGFWHGSFTLPDYDFDQSVVDVWWTMGCGNDAVRVGEGLANAAIPFPSPTPLPGASVLCAIGIAACGAVSLLRRRRRSKT